MAILRRSSHSKASYGYTCEEVSVEELSVIQHPRTSTSKSTECSPSTSRIPTPRCFTDKQRHRKQPSNKFLPERLIRLGWWWEAGAMVLAIGCVSSIIAILFYMNGKPLQEWKLPIQPNSLVAVFSTVAKSALLFAVAEGLGQLKWLYFEKPRALSQMENFDQASRGPWGACVFVWKVRGTALLASLGAFATVLMLAFEPVTQQVIEFSTRVSLQHNQTGWYSTAYAWSDKRLNDTHELPSSSYADLPLRLGLLGVMSEHPVSEQDNFYCPASQCHFPEFSSLGLCAVCETETVHVKNFDDCTYGVSDPEDLTYRNITSFQDYLQNASSPVHAFLQLSCISRKDEFPSLLIQTSASLVDATWTNHPDGRTTVSNVDYLTIAISNQIDGVRTYMVKAINGTVTETKSQYIQGCISEYPASTPFTSHTTVITYTCFNLTADIGLYNDLSQLGQVNGTITRCRLETCGQTYKQTTVKNNQFFPGEVLDVPLETNNNWTEGNQDSRFGFRFGWDGIDLLGTQLQKATGTDAYSNTATYDSGLVKTLNGNFTELFHRLATACSVVMQSSKNPETKKVIGDAYGPEVFVKVRWAWLIMPLSVVLISTVFMILTVVQSWKIPYLYKTSSLATLFHGLENSALEDHGGFKEYEKEMGDDMMETSKKMRVRLGCDRNGRLKLKKE